MRGSAVAARKASRVGKGMVRPKAKPQIPTTASNNRSVGWRRIRGIVIGPLLSGAGSTRGFEGGTGALATRPLGVEPDWPPSSDWRFFANGDATASTYRGPAGLRTLTVDHRDAP